jgi:PAT family beta-lactamase induction signal transducer AmpG
LGLGPHFIHCRGDPLHDGDDGFGRPLQTPWHLEHRYRPLYELVLSSLGHQATLEPLCRPFQDEALLDPSDAALDRGISGLDCIHRPGKPFLSIHTCLLVAAGVFAALFLYHFFILPHPVSDHPAIRNHSTPFSHDFLHIFGFFFRKKGIIAILAFFLFFRFAETQVVKILAPFLLDPRSKGGLELTTSEVGIIYGTVGVIALLMGGLLGGYVISRKGLKFWIWVMVCAVHFPDLVYVFLSQTLTDNLLLINLCVAVEQFGYGFGFTAYTMFMIMVSEGEYKTVHYALGTGIMALGMMLPAMFSGWLQEQLGYQNFFLWVMAATIPGFIVTALVKIDPEFGKKKE